MTTVMAEKMHEEKKAREAHVSLADVRRQMLNFGNQIHAYLDKVEADVEGYRFVVEKHGDGVEVEVQFKALVRPKHKPTDIPK